MITFEPAPDNVIAVRVEGNVSRDDVRLVVDKVDQKLSTHDRIGIVSDVTHLQGMTIGGMLEDIKSELKYLGHWEKFPHLALIVEDGFLKSATVAVGSILPKVEVQVFSPAQRDAAIAFAAAEAKRPEA